MKNTAFVEKNKVLNSYRDSHLSHEKGESYHKMFFENPYRSLVWQLEMGILDRIFTDYLADHGIHHLDFACGTGRILRYFEESSNTSVGVDLSPSMLEVARNNKRKSEIYQADLTREDVLGERKFNLITAFRFFPNAEPELRLEAMQVLVKHLDINGYLIFNNHKNLGCSTYRISRILGRGGDKGMSISEMMYLLAKNDLEVVNIYHLCVFPATERHMLLPRSFLLRIEVALSRLKIFRNIAENIIFICRHAKK